MVACCHNSCGCIHDSCGCIPIQKPLCPQSCLQCPRTLLHICYVIALKTSCRNKKLDCTARGLNSNPCTLLTADLKGGGHAKKAFLILVSNGQLNGEIVKYAFLKFFIP